MADGSCIGARGGRRVRAEKLRAGHLRAALAALVAYVPLYAAASEKGFYLDLGVSAGGGYDSNVFMDYEGSVSPGIVSAPFVGGSPEAALRYESKHAGFFLPFSSTLQHFTNPGAGFAASWSGQPGFTLRAGKISFIGSFIVDGYSISGFPEDNNIFYGGDAAFEVRPSDAWGVYAGYEGGQRAFLKRTGAAGGSINDTEHRASTGFLVAPARFVAIVSGYAYERVSSDDGVLDQGNHEAHLKLPVTLSRAVAITPFLRVKIKSYDIDGRKDRFVQEGISIEYRFTDWMTGAVHFTRTDNLSSETGMSYARNLGLASLEFSVPLKLGREVPLWAEDLPSASLMPRVEGDEVVFLYKAPAAIDLRLIGSFNGWDPAGVRMRRSPDGIWSVEVPRGGADIVYHFMVDGVSVAPQEAPLLTEDGFGGFNGIVPVQ